jgi:LacI family transcriptional regulator
MAATIKDVAASAGVSIATVSNVLNGKHGEYADETRSRVIDAARRVGYHRNRVARSLVRRTSECLGVTFVDQNLSLGENYYLVEVLDGIVNAAYEQGYNVSLHTRLRPDLEAEQLPDLLDRRIDGLFLIAPHNDSPLIPRLAESALPFVVIGIERPGPAINWIDVDNGMGAAMAADHLLKLGHRRIAHIAGHPRQWAAQVRARSFRKQVEAAGGECRIIPCSRFDQGDARDAARKILGSSDRPTAIFAANDGMALGVLQAAAERGLRVPHDLSVIGFDDMREAASTEPALTTIRQPMGAMGRRAAEWLVARLKDESHPALAELAPPELIVRASTAAPAA